MSDRYLMGIDLGTSSVKVLIATADGQVASTASAEYPILQPQPMFAEQDPEAWWQATVQAVRAAAASLPAVQIAAIGLSGQMHGTVLLDRAHKVLAPAVIWPDQRSQRQVQEITQLVGPEQLYAIAGSPVSTGFQAATLRWFQQAAPALWAQVGTVLLPKDYLRFRMTGLLASDPSDGSGALLLDEEQRNWSSRLLEILNIAPEIMPPIQPSDSIAGQLTAAAANAFGLPAGIPVITGAADTACSALGGGAIEPNHLLLSISTGGQLIQPVAQMIADPHGRIHTFCTALQPRASQAGWYQMGATLSAGMALRWLRDSLFEWHYADAYDVMNMAAESSPPGAQGLLFLPYLVGERTPHMDPNARGVFYGLTLRTGQGDLVRAVMEGVTFACYDAYQVLAELGVSSQSITLAGGGAKSRLWRQIIADIFGLPVRPLLTAEQSALGAVLLAGGGAGLFEIAATAQRWVQLGAVAEPDAERHAFYQERFAAFQAVYARNKGYF